MRFISLSLLITSIFAVPSVTWSKDRPAFECKLSIRGIKTGKEIGICSGTYLNNQVFISAAHCTDILDAGAELMQTRNYFVDCKGETSRKVESIAVHPQYYDNGDRKVINSFLVDSLVVFAESPSSTGTNDIALFLTEPNSLTEFPQLPAIDYEKPYNYKANSCRFAGYSPTFCDEVTGKGCYRERLTLEAINLADYLKIEPDTCDLVNPKNCSLAGFYGESASPGVPLMLRMVDQNKNDISGHGDSGAGVLCEDDRGQEVLAGVVVGGVLTNVVNVGNKAGFISHFLNYSREDFRKAAKTFYLSERYRRTLIAARTINSFFRSLKYDDILSPLDLGLYSVETMNIDVVEELVRWIRSNPSEVAKKFKELEIRKIDFSSLPNNSDVKIIREYKKATLELNQWSKLETIIDALDNPGCYTYNSSYTSELLSPDTCKR